MTAAGTRALRIVLFGRPGAGKSSLLAALPQAIPGTLDPDGSLAALAARQQDTPHQPTITAEQVVPYPVTFPATSPRGRPVDAVFFDCDGNDAGDLLDRDIALRGPLVETIRQADAVLLVVPANEPFTESERTRFERLSRRLEEERGQALLAGGLPLVVALTKADLLALPGDAQADWEARAKAQARAFDRLWQRDRRPPAFGQVSRRPALPTAIAGTPYHIAEVFRRCLDDASAYRRGQRRMTWRLAEMAGVLLLIVAALIAFGWFSGGVRSQADQHAIRFTTDELLRWYQQALKRGQALERFDDYIPEQGGRVPWPSWYKEVEGLFREVRERTHTPEEHLPGSDSATYEAVFASDRLRKAMAAWQELAAKLEVRRDVVSALGLVEQRPGKPPLLRVPAPPDLTPEVAATIVTRLDQDYPDNTAWSVNLFPPAIARELRGVVESMEANVLQLGREEVLAELRQLAPDGRETPQLWRKLREWLEVPASTQGWGELTARLQRLAGAQGPTAVQTLATFLNQPTFDLELQRLVFKLPRQLKLTPNGKLTIYLGDGEEVRSTLIFRIQGEPREDEQVARWTFVPDAGAGVAYRLVYRPGDTVWADLPVQTADKKERVLTWSLCRSQAFQFERLTRPPRLHKPEQVATDGELILDAGLQVSEGVVPRLPDLLPVVKLAKPKTPAAPTGLP